MLSVGVLFVLSVGFVVSGVGVGVGVGVSGVGVGSGPGTAGMPLEVFL